MSLLDSGSTHNFLDAAMAMKLKLQIDTYKILEVKVANGAVVKTKGVCYGVQLTLDAGYQIYGGASCHSIRGL